MSSKENFKNSTRSIQRSYDRNSLPGLRSADVIAILASDIHLSLQPPPCRAKEPNWFDAMARQLTELQQVSYKLESPIFYAGDIFDKWNAPAELINFALSYLPPGLAIPGQHDLPLHNYEDIEKSAYWTLCKAARIKNLASGVYTCRQGLKVKGFPWGTELKSIQRGEGGNYLALVHKYVWTFGKSVPELETKESEEHTIKKKLKGFDAIHTGDNHKSFIVGNLCNPGSFFRRFKDEVKHRPMVGILLKTGKIVPYYFDISADVFEAKETDNKKETETEIEIEGLVEELSKLEDKSLDFITILKRTMRDRKMGKETERVLLTALEKK